MIVTATTQQNPQTLAVFRSTSGSYYADVRCIGWISQNKTDKKTTLYYFWANYYNNYWPYWNDAHAYSLTVGGQTKSHTFAMPSPSGNGYVYRTSPVSITLTHGSDGKYSGTIRFRGYKFFEAFDYSEAISFPDIPIPEPTPEPTPVDPEPEPPAPIEVDNDPHYYIYADSDLVYAAGIEGYEVLNPKLTVEVNKAGSLQFDIPMGSEMYNQINKLKTTVEARQGNEVLFRGRLLNTKRNMMNTITCYNEGFLSWLVDVVLTPYQRSNMPARDLLKLFLTWYNSRASENRKIVYKYSDISANVSIKSDNHSNVWEQIKNVLVDGVGGYIVPYLTTSETGIQWLSTYGASTSQVIQFGQSLLDFNEYIDASAVFTAVRPYGKEVNGTRVSLPEEFITNDEAIGVFGRIERTAIFDEITTVAALRTVATNYLRTGIQTAVSITIKAVDMHLLNLNVERIRLGDSVRVVSVPHGIDAYFLCTKIVYDFAHPKNTEFTFGATQRTISELTDASYNRYVITEGDSL